jgi:predicted RNA methylase
MSISWRGVTKGGPRFVEIARPPCKVQGFALPVLPTTTQDSLPEEPVPVPFPTQVRRFLQGCLRRLRGSRIPRRYLATRQLLLEGRLATEVLDLRQIRECARKLSGDPDDLSLYGLATPDWYSRGIRLTGRTVIELTRDSQARFIAESVTATLSAEGCPIATVVDLFVGSGNLLYHVLRTIGAPSALAVDANGVILNMTKHNYQKLELDGMKPPAQIQFIEGDWREALGRLASDIPASGVPDKGAVLALVDPPWGAGYSREGLDLRLTHPPVLEILNALSERGGGGLVYAVVKTIPQLVTESLQAIAECYPVLESRRSKDRDVGSRVHYLLIRVRPDNASPEQTMCSATQ